MKIFDINGDTIFSKKFMVIENIVNNIKNCIKGENLK